MDTFAKGERGAEGDFYDEKTNRIILLRINKSLALRFNLFIKLIN